MIIRRSAISGNPDLLKMPASFLSFLRRSTPFSVMVADHAADIQKLMPHWLRELGCVATCVSTGKDAIRVVHTVQVDVVITGVSCRLRTSGS